MANYYLTTLMNAAIKLGPLLLFILVGYFIFIKLPFLFFLRNMNITKKEFEQKLPEDFQKDYTLDNYKDFQRRMRLLNSSKNSNENQSKQEEKTNKEQKTESRQQKRQEKKAGPKQETQRPRSREQSPEEIFEMAPGQNFSKEELRKRYYELLKKNHPDRVASMGSEFKSLAEKNTKEINRAYEKLKSKAA